MASEDRNIAKRADPGGGRAYEVGRRGSDLLHAGSPAFRRANLALFVAGLAVFAILYCVQPLLTNFSAGFGLSPAEASLSLSASTLTLAFSLIFASSLSEVWGRKPVMALSLAISAILALLLPFSPNFGVLLAVRALEGVALSGVPAVAMAYVGEEVHPESFGLAMGLYIGGNSVGGMVGRVASGAIADAFSWRVSLGVVGVTSALFCLVFWLLLPRSQHFEARPLRARELLGSLHTHIKDAGLRCLYAVGALIMGGFVASYNYIGYRLLGAPYHLSQVEVGWIFVLYLVGTVGSSWMGRLADHFGHRVLLPVALSVMLTGTLLTLAQGLAVVVAGIGVLTFGFFGAHSLASGWVSERANSAKAQASGLYLLCYYFGSSIGGYAGGFVYTAGGWSGEVAMVSGLIIVALIVAARLVFTPPLSRR